MNKECSGILLCKLIVIFVWMRKEVSEECTFFQIEKTFFTSPIWIKSVTHDV